MSSLPKARQTPQMMPPERPYSRYANQRTYPPCTSTVTQSTSTSRQYSALPGPSTVPTPATTSTVTSFYNSTTANLSPGPADAGRSLSQSSPSHVLSPGDMEYTLADLDAIYRDQVTIQPPPAIDDNQEMLDEDLQPAEILNNNLFDFGDIKEDMPDFQCNFLDNLDEELDDPDSASSGRLVIDQKMPTPTEPEPDMDSD